MDLGFIYLALMRDGGEAIGLFILCPKNAATFEIHVCMMPAAYGQLARQAMRDAFAWTWRNTSRSRVIGEIPETNRLALKYAMNCGMRMCGYQPHAWQCDGNICGLISVGISRPGLEA